MRPASYEWNGKLVEWVHKKFFKKPGNLIDLGCGQGEIINFFKKLGYSSEGYDYPEIDLEKSLKFKSHSYDFVICKFVFEHIRNINKLMSEIYRILKPGGMVIIFTDNAPANWKKFLADPTHITPFSLARLRNLALINKFKIIEVRKWRNIPYIWRYTTKAFDFSFPMSNQLIGIFKK